MISFYVGCIFGIKLFCWILGDKELDKYLDMMKGCEKVVFFLIMLFLGFFDDIICMVVGIIFMWFRFFLIILFIIRIIFIYLIVYGVSFIWLDIVWGWVIWIVIYVIIFYIG